MYKKDWALNNIQWLIYHPTKPNQTETYYNKYPIYSSQGRLFKTNFSPKNKGRSLHEMSFWKFQSLPSYIISNM